MTHWTTISTVDQDLESVLDFVAFMSLHGAQDIMLYFPRANHKAIPELAHVANVQVTICDSEYWKNNGGKPKSLEAQKARNLAHGYLSARSDWVIALDCNEWLGSTGQISEALGAFEGQIGALVPYERFEHRSDGLAGYPDAIFRPALAANQKGVRFGSKCYGKSNYPKTNRGLLGPLTGRYALRTGRDFSSAEFEAISQGQVDTAPRVSNLVLLRNYARNYDEWLSVSGETKSEETAEFYNAINVYNRSKAPFLRRRIAFQLFAWLKDYRQELFEHKTPYFHNIELDENSGMIEGDINWDGLKMRLRPAGNYTELRLSRGSAPEADEHDIIKNLVKDQRVRFYDVGGNAGVYSLRVAQYSSPKSKITAYEPNPEMAFRLERNLKLNDFKNVEVKRKAVSAEKGIVHFAIHPSNLGQSRVVEGETGMEVPTVALFDEFEDPKDYDLSLLKVDVEGFEPMVFASLFAHPPEKVYWPNYILMEQAHSEGWRDELFARLRAVGYETHFANKLNIIWHRPDKIEI